MVWIDHGSRIRDELWARIEPLLPPKKPQPKGGHPWTSDRQAIDGIFYVPRTGCRRKGLPPCCGAPGTLDNRFQAWAKPGVFHRLWREGLLEHDHRKALG